MPELPPRLSIELVPESLWYKNLRSLLSRRNWEIISRDTAVDAAQRCSVCDERGKVECHEIWEYDDELHVQTLTGTTALCPTCHQVKHFGLSVRRGLGPQVTRHLADINGWTEQQTTDHIDAAFALWNRRNRFVWTQNLSWLSRNYPEMPIKEVQLHQPEKKASFIRKKP